MVNRTLPVYQSHSPPRHPMNMFRRRKASEAERSRNISSKCHDLTEDGIWYNKATSGGGGGGGNRFLSEDASCAAVAYSSSPLASDLTDEQLASKPPAKSQEIHRNISASRRGQDDDDESAMRPSQSTNVHSVESAKPVAVSPVAKHIPPVSNKASMLKGGDLIALIVCEEWDQASKALDENPKVARIPQVMALEGHDSKGLPLHLTACSKPPFKFLEKLLKAFPDATKTPDEVTGRLPVHWACICGASVPILKLLLDNYPGALASLDTLDGRLPLHYACLFASTEVVELLVKSEKRAVVYKDSSGFTPYDLVEQAAINPYRDSILAVLKSAKDELQKSKLRRHRDKEHSSHSDNQSSRKPPAVASKSKYLPNVSNLNHPNLMMDSSVYSDWENPTSISVPDSPASQASSQKKLASIRSLFGRVGGGSHVTKPAPVAPSPVAASSRTIGMENSPHDESFNTGMAVSSPWSAKPKYSDRAAYPSHALPTSLQRSITQNEFSHQQQHINERTFGITDTSRAGLPEPPLVRGHSAFDGSNTPTRKNSSVPLELQHRLYTLESQSSSSMAQSEVVSSYNQELSFHKQKLVEKDSDLTSLEAQVRMLDLRSQALTEECRNAEAFVIEKQNVVDKKQKTIARLRSEIAQLQVDLNSEESALELAESSLIVHRETLAEHENKLRATEDEKNSLTAIRESILDQKHEISCNISSIEAEMRSLGNPIRK